MANPLRSEPDPILRARQASALINDLQQELQGLAEIRREAIEEAHAKGLSYTRIAHEIGLTKGRVTQIRQRQKP